MNKIRLLLYLNFFYLHGIEIHKEIRQLLVVTVDHVQQTKALLYAYEKSDDKIDTPWNAVFDAIPVILGRHGIGLGLGLHHEDFNANQALTPKIEGDGKSPAGLFKLSTIFGYAKQTPNTKMPYLSLTKDIHCVDDSSAKQYNTIISKTSGYKSFEKMRREDDLYEWGIIVDHNPEGIKKRGSCIFIHIMKKAQTPTAGCTAMSRADLLKIIKWLDKSKQPALLQYLSR